MPRLAVLADIHGNLPALGAVLDDMRQFRVDQVVLAGDVVNWGPFSAQVMRRVMQEGWAVIRGNNELYLLDHGTERAPAHWQNYTIPPFLRRQLEPAMIHAIACWSDSLTLRFSNAPLVRVVHGSPRSHFEPIYPQSTGDEIAAMLDGISETTLICGHTHLAMDRQVGGWHLLNPGTVGVPLDGTYDAQYMILDGDTRGWRATFRRVPYDRTALFEEFERLRFVEHTGVVGHLVIKEFRTARLEVHPFFQWHQATHPDEPQTFELLQRFAGVDKHTYVPAAYQVNEQ